MTNEIDVAVRHSSGNVFADLGLPDAKNLSLKADLALKIGRVMKAQGLNQTKAAELAGVSQPDISRILRGEFRDVSMERLIRILLGLKADVDITVRHDGRLVGDVIHVVSDGVVA